MRIIGAEAEAHLSWLGLTRAIEAGHRQPRAEIKDMFLYRGKDTLLVRAAWIDGLGQLVKAATPCFCRHNHETGVLGGERLAAIGRHIGINRSH